MAWLYMLLSLTLTIYNEAGGRPHDEMQLVADTVINRVHSPEFPNTVTDVIYQPRQFDWTRKFKHRNVQDLVKAEKYMVSKYEPNKGSMPAKWREALGIAYKSLQPGYKPKNSYLYFRSHGNRNHFRHHYQSQRNIKHDHSIKRNSERRNQSGRRKPEHRSR